MIISEMKIAGISHREGIRILVWTERFALMLGFVFVSATWCLSAFAAGPESGRGETTSGVVGAEGVAASQVDQPLARPAQVGQVEWCQTQARWERKVGVAAASMLGCPLKGACDDPAERDIWIPDPSTPIVTVRTVFHVFSEDDGSNLAATQADVDAQLVQLNSDYLPSRIQFVGTTNFINDSRFRQFADSEEGDMKATYVVSPAEQLNVYVVRIQGGYIGVGTFPWDPDALGTMGGIVIHDNTFGAGEKTLTHEVGHCLGLWHTQHGVSEVGVCSNCWERADGVDGDTTGDFASDTAPTPTNFNCSPPGGTDSCSGIPWGGTDPQNYMGYAPDSCYTEFTIQQDGRQHCWTTDVLWDWFGDPRGACCASFTCSIDTEANCLAIPGTYLGDGTTCESAAGSPIVYASTVGASIPDAGGPKNAVSHVINVPDSFTIGDVDVDLQITHPWVGDLIVTVTHGTTSVVVVNRPGDGHDGCGANNYDIILDDEGSGGAIQALCIDNLTSPPNLTPRNVLIAFDGMDAAGAWTITVSDNVSGELGTLDGWSVHIDAAGSGVCAPECEDHPDCDDGLTCNGSEVCVDGLCLPGTAVDCNDPNCYGDPVCCGDLSCDPLEDQCSCETDCGAPPPTEAGLCSDDKDNDCDGCMNSVDADCGGVETNCADGLDDDCDGLVDCDDSADCSTDPTCCAAVLPPTYPLAETHARNKKNRYLSFVPGDPGRVTALRVTVNLSNAFPAAVGSTWWVGPPTTYCENAAHILPPAEGCGTASGIPGLTFLSSDLQCNRHCMDWGSLGDVVHIGDINIVPDTIYKIEAVDCVCSRSSTAMVVGTTKWGDAVQSCATCPCDEPDTVVNITTDVTGVLNKFKNLPCAIIKTRADLEPAVPDRQINIGDVTASLNGFRGFGYTFPEPEGCP